jgi:hypothetical protein
MLKRSDKPMSEAEIAKANAESTLRAVNESVRKLNPGETRVIGHVQKIDCKTKPISFLVKTPDGTFTVVSKDFQALDFNVFIPEADNVAVGCDANISAFNAVVTYKPAAAAKGTAKGDLLAIEFVADDFRIMSEAEMNQPSPRVVPQNRLDDKGAALDPQPSEQDLDKGRLDGMMQAMRSQLRQPAEGEKREFGFLEKMECSGKGVFMIFRTTTGTLRFSSPAQQQPAIRVFTPDLRGMQIGCTMKPIEYPVVFVYKDLPDAKAKTNGSIVALDFMPKSFTLDE